MFTTTFKLFQAFSRTRGTMVALLHHCYGLGIGVATIKRCAHGGRPLNIRATWTDNQRETTNNDQRAGQTMVSAHVCANRTAAFSSRYRAVLLPCCSRAAPLPTLHPSSPMPRPLLIHAFMRCPQGHKLIREGASDSSTTATSGKGAGSQWTGHEIMIDLSMRSCIMSQPRGELAEFAEAAL